MSIIYNWLIKESIISGNNYKGDAMSVKMSKRISNNGIRAIFESTTGGYYIIDNHESRLGQYMQINN